ncbi:hypothetical protein HXX76_008906 [Chlamydomonas incerta]|uniref:Protein kinase domain-containing protein n=1 Tax=Chlamydomonas incerta TaxID=51695 RepID=A0A835T6M5_CHLIN|nr:hypothetical protein HXX76_008906 [Chlamydomonas incerta]|eukprot:KAG2432561.1 hypothetical protein HXX76_008906 [Chlamydomonas incerta]
MGNCVSACAGRAEPYKAPVGGKDVAAEPKPLDVVGGKVHVDGDKPCIDSAAVESELIQNVLDHENGPAKGLPYQVHYLGPPVPPCEDQRLATIRALDKMSKPTPEEDPEIASILRLCTSMFQAPVALVALFDSKRVYISGSEGNVIPCGDFPWRWTLCAWSLAYNNAQCLVIPDTLQDARFRENAKVTGYPGVRFYCGAPLIASNGHRLGTICFADVSARPGFDAASCSVMNNLSELVVRHLEKDLALKLKSRDNDALKATYGQLQRTLDCFDHCVVLVDVSVPGWKVLHINAAWSKLTGVERVDVLSRPLSEIFEGAEGMGLPNPELEKAANKCYDFQVTGAKLKLPSALGAPKGGFVLTFRPASREGLDEHVVPIGVPAFLRTSGLSATSSSGEHASAASAGGPVSGDIGSSEPLAASARRFYFMSVDLTGRAMSSKASSVLSGATSTWSTGSEVVEGLELGHLLGKGSFGSVYFGTWMGTSVAVKVMDTDVRKALRGVGSVGAAAMEAILGQQLRHPNVVATLKWAARRLDRPNAANSLMSSMDVSATDAGESIEKAKAKAAAAAAAPAAVTPSPAGTAAEDGGAPAAANAPGESPWPVINFADSQIHALEEMRTAGPGTSTAHNTGVAHNTKSSGVNASTDWPPLRASMDEKVQSHTGSALVTPAGPGDKDSGSCASNMVQTWIIMEFCDRGSLQEAIDRGWLRTERSALSGGPNMAAVLATAREVAAAMSYLHANSVVHGDLSGWNVMLASAGAAAAEGGRGFVAKVADFGLSRTLELRSKMQTANYGTLSHMPPELVLNGTVSRAVDVYSFGVLLWQMYTGSRPWSGLTHSQIIMMISKGEARLQFPSGTPKTYEALMRACTAAKPEERPAFADVVKQLEEMLEEYKTAGFLE